MTRPGAGFSNIHCVHKGPGPHGYSSRRPLISLIVTCQNFLSNLEIPCSFCWQVAELFVLHFSPQIEFQKINAGSEVPVHEQHGRCLVSRGMNRVSVAKEEIVHLVQILLSIALMDFLKVWTNLSANPFIAG